MDPQKEDLTLFQVFVFWVPLALTWLMMSVEGPFLAALIARLPDPKFNLAAYGVAFSIALIVEAPVIMLMGASTTLVRNHQAFVRVRRFAYFLSAGVTALMALLLLPESFDFLIAGLLNLPAPVAQRTWIACLILLPWPGAIGYRRFYQGILIRHGRTSFVAYGTVVRLSAMVGTGVLFAYFDFLPGAAVGAAALSAGVIVEACASRLMVHRFLKILAVPEHDQQAELTYGQIFAFYLPLALTSILALGIRPMVTFFVGQSRLAIESLAVLPVVQSLIFLFVCLGLSYQEVVIALAGERLEQYPVLRRFALLLGGGAILCLTVINFTPLAWVWFKGICGLSETLATLALRPARILTPAPALWVLVCFQRAILMRARTTGPITRATAVEVSVILVMLFMLIKELQMVGAVAAAAALLAGRAVSPAYLYAPFKRALKSASFKAYERPVSS